LEFALQGAKLFVQRKANVISLRIDTITKWHQDELNTNLDQ
jgi:hypothetical protein